MAIILAKVSKLYAISIGKSRAFSKDKRPCIQLESKEQYAIGKRVEH